MSSAMAMVLMAAMAIPGNGPERASGEVKQGLDLRGRWEGLWVTDHWTYRVELNEMVMKPSADDVEPCHDIELTKLIDEGQGQLSFRIGQYDVHGIYKWDGDCFLVCFSPPSCPRPTSFTDRQDDLFILHRVKPGK